jgi:hypothetical protein
MVLCCVLLWQREVPHVRETRAAGVAGRGQGGSGGMMIITGRLVET